MKQHLQSKQIALMGMLMALQLIVTRFLALETPIVRISFLFIPTVIMAMLFGPWLTGIGSTLSDFIGIFLFPKSAPYFPGFSLSAFLTGVIYGHFFYRKEITLKRVIIANVLVTFIIDLGLNTLWLYMIMNKGMWALLPTRLVTNGIMLPIRIIVIYSMGQKNVLTQKINQYVIK